MNITLNTEFGRIMINSDTVRMYVPIDKGGTSVFFVTGHRTDVQESLDEINEKLIVNHHLGLG